MSEPLPPNNILMDESEVQLEKDKYDVAEEYLLQFKDDPESFTQKADQAWSYPCKLFPEPTDIAHCLFQAVSPTGKAIYNLPGGTVGCLTQIRGIGYQAITPELTQEIKNDKRIPKTVDEITPESLAVFKEWQRRLDKEIRS